MSNEIQPFLQQTPLVQSQETEEAIHLIKNLLQNVREEMNDNPYLSEAIRVLPVGGYRSAIGSFWNAVVDDLRRKVMFRSLNLFNKEVNPRREVKTYEDFQDYVNDDELIDGAYKIGVIGWEASKILKHAKETRHIFDGHPNSSQPSIVKVLDMMNDCIKYVLSVEMPMQIIDISEYINNLGTDTYDRNSIAIENALGDLPEHYKNELINRLFTAYIHPNSSTILRSNIEFCVPILWKVLPLDIKRQIVRRIDPEIGRGNKDTISFAFKFIEMVQGVRYLSTTAKKYVVLPLIEWLEQNLDKWSVENECVEKLEPYASIVPLDLMDRYVNSITQTYVGKMGNSLFFSRDDFYANGAALIIPGMFEKFDDNAIYSFVKSIKTNTTLKNRVRYPSKLERLRALGYICLEKASSVFKERAILELLTNPKEEHKFFQALSSQSTSQS